ncbi:MAG: hypothetical protein JWN76_1410 [Chitinophagaceae bacterium]|nr:hypothetical protein [Chitinophagaceae bacterium]
MNKILVVLLTTLSIFSSTHAQLNSNQQAALEKMEDSMLVPSREMILNESPSQRFNSDSIFTRRLVKALQVTNSFYYPFDSITTVSKLYSPDSSFRIFTWQFEKDLSYYRQRGAIQMRTKDGSLKLFPLIDMSDFTPRPTDSIRTNRNWIGAIYYNIVLKESNGKKFYTLLGYDDNDFTSTRKWIDVLTFDEQGTPRFGDKIFDYKYDSIKTQQPVYRFLLEYKKDGRARMNYDRDLDMIVFEHLVSESNEPQKTFTLIPDGDYEGFKWQNGKWVHVEKIYDQKIDMTNVDPLLGNAPLEDPLLDATGKKNEKKLEDVSQKNRQKEEQSKKPVVPPKKKPA